MPLGGLLGDPEDVDRGGEAVQQLHTVAHAPWRGAVFPPCSPRNQAQVAVPRLGCILCGHEAALRDASLQRFNNRFRV